MRIANGFVRTMEGADYPRGFVDFEGSVITAVGSMEDAPAYEGEVLDAAGCTVLPGFIDAHSHIGISEEGKRWEGEDCNESVDPVTPEMRAEDGFYPFDTAIPKARKAGISTVVVCPGSTNVIGGQAAAIKLNAASDVEEMLLKPACAIKCAMGENPKKCYGENDDRSPMTRMAIASILRETLRKAQRYLAKKEKGEDVYDAQMEALVPLLKGEIPMHVHAHRSDDILTALRIAKEFGLRCHIIHATCGREVIPQMKAAGALPIVGPVFGPAGKPETVGGTPETGADLEKAGLDFAITTDHDVEAIWLLPVSAAMMVREGLSEEKALEAITRVPARIAGIEDRVGSLRPGKDADIAVFAGDPLDVRTRLSALFINGKREA